MAHPNNPAPRIAKQGTTFANTAGYELSLFANDLHHHTKRGKIISACLYFIQIYGGKVCDIPIDFSVSTPLVTRLTNQGISPELWNKLASIADRSQPRTRRVLPGSDDDFQMRTVINGSVTGLCTVQSTTAGDLLTIELLSPLAATTNFAASVFAEYLPSGVRPTLGFTPGLQINRANASVLWSVPDLTNAIMTTTIPVGLSGTNMWLQGLSQAPSSTPGFTSTISDAQVITIL